MVFSVCTAQKTIESASWCLLLTPVTYCLALNSFIPVHSYFLWPLLFFQFVQLRLTFKNILQALSLITHGFHIAGDPTEIAALNFEEFKVSYQSGSKFWFLTY